MDTVTQALFGAVIGQTGFQPKLGRRALVAGAIAGTIPDLDVAMALVAGPFSEWQYHRGVTHSIFFAPLVGPLLGYAVWRYYRNKAVLTNSPVYKAISDATARRAWIWLMFLCLVTHPFLDLLTPYGTQLLAPLTDHRFAVNAMAIIDPVYTLPLVIALIVGQLFRRHPLVVMEAGAIALSFTIGWQIYASYLNDRAEALAREDLRAQGIYAAEIHAYPTLLQPFYRRITAETEDELRIAYDSSLVDAPLEWTRYPKAAHPFIGRVADMEAFRILNRFAMGQTFWQVRTLDSGNIAIEAHDLRYLGYEKELSSFWGIIAVFSPQGELLEAPKRFSRRPSDFGDALDRMWVGTFGG